MTEDPAEPTPDPIAPESRRGLWLRRMREAAGVTQAEVAKALGVMAAQLGYVERADLYLPPAWMKHLSFLGLCSATPWDEACTGLRGSDLRTFRHDRGRSAREVAKAVVVPEAAVLYLEKQDWPVPAEWHKALQVLGWGEPRGEARKPPPMVAASLPEVDVPVTKKEPTPAVPAAPKVEAPPAPARPPVQAPAEKVPESKFHTVHVSIPWYVPGCPHRNWFVRGWLERLREMFPRAQVLEPQRRRPLGRSPNLGRGALRFALKPKHWWLIFAPPSPEEAAKQFGRADKGPYHSSILYVPWFIPGSLRQHWFVRSLMEDEAKLHPGIRQLEPQRVWPFQEAPDLGPGVFQVRIGMDLKEAFFPPPLDEEQVPGPATGPPSR